MKVRPITLPRGVRAAWTADGTPEALAETLEARSFTFPKQVHGTTVEWVDDPTVPGLEADGLLTRIPGLLIGVRTADCLPVLLAHRTGPFVGAIHAGWRGLTGGILDATARRLTESGLQPADCIVFFGPSISSCCYEVGWEVGERFGRHFNGKTLDLKGFARERLSTLGFGNILDEPACTHCTPTLPSFRRDPACGRILTGIVIRNDTGCHP